MCTPPSVRFLVDRRTGQSGELLSVISATVTVNVLLVHSEPLS